MQAPTPCPNCGEYNLYRSHSRNRVEKILKYILPFKTYRCHNCSWRGWMSKRKAGGKGPIFKSVLFYIVVIILALIVAYILRSLIL